MQNNTLSISVKASEQVVEVARIFAAGIFRTKRRKHALTTTTNSFSASRLDFSPDSSVHCINPSAQGEKL